MISKHNKHNLQRIKEKSKSKENFNRSFYLTDRFRTRSAIITYVFFSVSNVRLAGSPISNAGRVEVFYLGGWGTVDNWGWDLNAAHVVCRQLGYPASLSSGYNNQFGSSIGPEWFRNVRCFGNETNLGECTKDVYGYISSGSSTITVLCKLPYQAGDLSTFWIHACVDTFLQNDLPGT